MEGGEEEEGRALWWAVREDLAVREEGRRMRRVRHAAVAERLGLAAGSGSGLGVGLAHLVVLEVPALDHLVLPRREEVGRTRAEGGAANGWEASGRGAGRGGEERMWRSAVSGRRVAARPGAPHGEVETCEGGVVC